MADLSWIMKLLHLSKNDERQPRISEKQFDELQKRVKSLEENLKCVSGGHGKFHLPVYFYILGASPIIAAFAVSLINKEAINSYPFVLNVFDLLESAKGALFSVGIIFIFSGLALQKINDVLKRFLNFFYANITKKIQDSTPVVKEFGKKTVDEFLESYRQEWISRIYGRHSSKDKSLFNYTTKMLLEPFCRTAHKSTYKTKIVILQDVDNPDVHVWTDTTTYKLHHPSAREHAETVYPLRLLCENVASESQRGENIFDISIKIDEKEVELGDMRLTDKIDTSATGYQVCVTKKHATAYFLKHITLNQEWTSVEMFEKSINSASDNEYVFTAYEPYYGIELDIYIPHGYTFTGEVESNFQHLYRAMPLPHQKKVAYQDLLTYEVEGNHLRFKFREWALPGLAFSVKWDKV